MPLLSAYLGPRRSGRHLLVPARRPGTARRSRPPAQRRTRRTPVTAIAATMQAFFTERLIAQRRASPHTIAAYRDTLRLLLGFAAQRTRTPPCRLDIADLDAPLISAFLDHLEQRAGQHHPQPQRPAGRDPLPVRLRGAAPSRARRRHRPGPGDPAQAGRPDDRHFPHRHRDRGPARRPGPGHPHRPPRPRLDPAGHPDRAAGLRAHRPDLPRRPSRHRRLRRLPRQGPQRPDHAARPRHRHHLARLARRDTPGHPATRCSPPSAAAR